MSSTSHDEFAARLGRIRQAQGQPAAAPPVPRSHEVARNALYPASLLGALLLGMVAVALGQYARFHLMAGAAELQESETEMLLAGGIGIGVAFVLSQAFRMTSKEHRGLQSVGVVLMVCGFHNLSHWMPGPMSLAFSPGYVQTVTATSPANSLRYGGAYMPLIDTAAPATPEASANAADTAPTPDPEAEEPTARPLPVVRKAGKIVAPAPKP